MKKVTQASKPEISETFSDLSGKKLRKDGLDFGGCELNYSVLDMEGYKTDLSIYKQCIGDGVRRFTDIPKPDDYLEYLDIKIDLTHDEEAEIIRFLLRKYPKFKKKFPYRWSKKYQAFVEIV